MFSFTVKKTLHGARLSELTTPHGTIAGPFFQFVATQAAIRGQVFSEDLEAMGVQVMLANTYHLMLRPGEELIAEAGGLHDFMQWPGPIATDSGGYQVFSLGKNVKLDDDGVTFRSPLDGSEHRLTPERAVQIQQQLGADIIMPLDIATAFTAARAEVETAVRRTTAWAKRCQAELAQASQNNQVLYGIIQGGLIPELREQSAAELEALNFFGYAIGGELRDATGSRMAEAVAMTAPGMPVDKPRWLLGAGMPEDIIRAVRLGVDQFDCVLPMRNARHGRLFRNLNQEEVEACLSDPEREVVPRKVYETLDIRKVAQARDFDIFSADNPAIGKDYSVAYVHHLLRVEAPSGWRLMVLNNIYFYVQLMKVIRDVIAHTGAAQ